MSLLRPRLAVESAFSKKVRSSRSAFRRLPPGIESISSTSPPRWLAAYSLQAPTRTGVGGRGSFETGFPGLLHICHCSKIERLK